MLYERTYTRSPILLFLGLLAGGSIIGVTLLGGYLWANWNDVATTTLTSVALAATILGVICFEFVRHR
jgi:hypothetical protein